ncbi:type II toxin-antitoxin system CcdA family antitoxin [Caballeronia sp. BCC1704]|uniref:type II toxin-antitoxin system CcdA family antitoxin n=1 Tax=Caballeronia sp. BCC1704 TaxID=2676300 RepID=UPI001FC7DA9E|nr:type II toxin-antitoxin system CcdA family antitoxin [Caballeronia sp. BCC1704]
MARSLEAAPFFGDRRPLPHVDSNAHKSLHGESEHAACDERLRSAPGDEHQPARDVYKDAKALGINFSQTCERAIRQAVQMEKDRQWAIKHADFIQAYNDMIERDGLPLGQYRTF